MNAARHTKRQHGNHLTGRKAVGLVESKLPEHWVVRELNPDYGLDLHIEVFDLLPDDSGSSDTLGEHFYAQVKGVENGVKKKIMTVRSRINVAKGAPDPDIGDEADIEVVTYVIDSNELITVEAMGSAVPALLFVADLKGGDVYFVCLNDYISKVLLPATPNYVDQETHTIHLPTWNVLDSADPSFSYLWLLARRGKYYAAFNTFAYQQSELDRLIYVPGAVVIDTWAGTSLLSSDILAMLGVFLRSNVRLDVWEERGPGFWSPMSDIRSHFDRLLDALPMFSEPRPSDEVQMFFELIVAAFKGAKNLGNIYEELVREWRLPTALALLTDDSAASKYRAIDHRRAKIDEPPATGSE